MRKLLLLVLVATIFVACQKNETETHQVEKDVSFKSTLIFPDGGLKSTADWDCQTDEPDHAWIQITHENPAVTLDFYPELFTVGNDLYTQSIKLIEGADYCLQNFVLYKESGDNEGYQAGEDISVSGVPQSDSDYAPYVGTSLEYCFNVSAFEKVEIPLEVLCFQEAEYAKFGFDWFAVTQIVIRQFCFFGDVCIDNPTLFEIDQYYSQGGVLVDEEAVFKVIVMNGNDEVYYSPYSNESIYGSGQALCVDYPDNLSVVNDFTFELQVWQPDANGTFVWQSYATFYSQDDGDLYDNDQYTGTSVVGTDGVVDFAVGNCSPDSYPIFDWMYPNANVIESLVEDSFINHSLSANMRVGQTFTTGAQSKQLESIDVKLLAPGNGGLLVIDLYEFDENTGALTFVASSNSGGYYFGTPPNGVINNRTFSSSPVLQPNSTYAFLFRNGGWNFFDVSGSAGGASYGGGTAFKSTAGAGNNDPQNVNYNPEPFDLWFQINLQ